jgi:queuine tRNA-ribosyltransferase
MRNVRSALSALITLGIGGLVLTVSMHKNTVWFHRGVDMFDCVIPTREGRHGRLFSWVAGSDAKLAKALASGKGQDNFYTIHNLANQKFVSDKTAINSNSKLPELRNYSRAYLHYLFKIDEALAQRLTTLNNLEFYLDLMAKLRQIIKTNSAN